MGAKGATEILHRGASDIDQKQKEYEEVFCNPLPAARRGFVDDVITPSQTRRILIEDLALLRNKKLDNPWKKHSNIPL